MVRRLIDMGFKPLLEDFPDLRPPTRVTVHKDFIGDPNVVYIGRGHGGLGLARSLWANPFPISYGNPRKKVLKQFKMYFDRTPALFEQLSVLAGKRLACHCPPEAACHGDILVNAFTDKYCTLYRQPPTDETVEAEAKRRRTEVIDYGCRRKWDPPASPSLHAGTGDPMMIYKGGVPRLLVDCGGLCSLGLWPPGKRGKHHPLGFKIKEQLRLALAKGDADVDAILHKMAAQSDGKEKSVDPFPEEAILAAREGITALVGRELKEWAPISDPLPQNVHVRLLGVLLHGIGDPDWEALKIYEAGVPLGVDSRLPRTPLIFPEKVRWNVPGQEDADPDSKLTGVTMSNYASTDLFKTEVKKVLDDQTARGQIEVVTEAEAKRRFGSKLSIASLAAIEKGVNEDGSTDVRIVHDGTNGVGINGRIKVLDYVAHPGSIDVQGALRYCQDSGLPYYGVTADVSEAHRQVRVRQQDVGYQACQLEPGGLVYLNLVGTYGVASAGYWWSRLAACLVRLVHAVMGDLPLWIFLYSDDWLFFTGGSRWKEGAVLPLFLLRVLGLPLSWKKVNCGRVVGWIGLEINLREHAMGLSARRAAWVAGWLGKTLVAGEVKVSELAQAVGRMQFAYGVLVWDRPFLAPLYTLLAIFPSDAVVSLPGFVKAALYWLKERIETRRTIPCGRLVRQQSSLFRIDAKAEGQNVAIGGWMPFRDSMDGSIVKSKSAWFAVRVTAAEAPWAFEKRRAVQGNLRPRAPRGRGRAHCFQATRGGGGAPAVGHLRDRAHRQSRRGPRARQGADDLVSTLSGCHGGGGPDGVDGSGPLPGVDSPRKERRGRRPLEPQDRRLL